MKAALGRRLFGTQRSAPDPAPTVPEQEASASHPPVPSAQDILECWPDPCFLVDRSSGHILQATGLGQSLLEQLRQTETYKAVLPEAAEGLHVDTFCEDGKSLLAHMGPDSPLPWRGLVLNKPETLHVQLIALTDAVALVICRRITVSADRIDELEVDASSAVAELFMATQSLGRVARTMRETVEKSDSESQRIQEEIGHLGSLTQSIAARADETREAIGLIGNDMQSAADRAQKTAATAQEAQSTIRQLSQASERIGMVMTLIQDIAEQTNLLALNATIEAARAGDAGRGFAVVASEVKALATQTARATEDITTQIKDIQNATATTVTAMATVSGSISSIADVATRVAETIDGQEGATQQVSSDIQTVATKLSVISEAASSLSTVVADSSHGASDVDQAMAALSRQVEFVESRIDALVGSSREP